jgi:HEAT repeat protein
MSAAHILGAYKNNHEAIPALEELLNCKDDQVREAAVYAIGSIHTNQPTIIAALEALLQEDNSSLRYATVWALNEIDHSMVSGLSVKFVRALSEGDKLYRIDSARALGIIGPEPGVVQALALALSDQDPEVRMDAAHSLGQFGPKAGSAIPYLIKASKDASSYVRGDAIIALGNIGRYPGVLEALTKALNDQIANVKEAAARSLEQFGPDSIIALPKLIEAMNERIGFNEYLSDFDIQEPLNRAIFADAIGAIGKNAITAMPRLIEALNDDDGNVRVSAAMAIRSIDPTAFDVIGQLIRELDNESPMIRASAVLALNEICLGARRSLPKLFEIAEINFDTNICLGYVEKEARQAIENIEK